MEGIVRLDRLEGYLGGEVMRWFSSSRLVWKIRYKPPVTRKQIRQEVEQLDIPREAAILAQSKQPPLDETRPSAIESSINELFEEARGEATQATLDRIGDVSRRASELDLEGDESDYALALEALAGDLAELAADAGLEFPPRAREQADAELAKRAFLRAHKIFPEPSFEPSLLQWSGVGVLITVLEALLTATMYIPSMGEPGGIAAAGLVGVSIAVAALIISCGILLAKHRRNTLAKIVGPLVAVGGALFFVFVSLCAAHLRLFLTSQSEGGSSSLEAIWGAIQIATQVWESLKSQPQLPLTDPLNLGFMSLGGITMSGFVYETNRTWSYWGYRPVALRAHRAVRAMKKKTKEFSGKMKAAGKRSELAVGQQVGELKRKDREARSLMNEFLSIINSHSVAMAIIAAEHQRSLAVLLEAYRASVAEGRKIADTFATKRDSGIAQSDIILPANFDDKLKELQRSIYSVIKARAQAQAEIDRRVSAAIRSLTDFIERELAKANGLETPDQPTPPFDGPSLGLAYEGGPP